MLKERPAAQPERPSDLRSVFGRNLKELAARESSVSSLCTRLGINRTQFNRYLAGETFPRPDVLHRICNYFEVDARILLEPLSSQHEQGTSSVGATLANFVLAGNDFNIDHARLPDGLYRYWRNSFTWPDKILVDMCRIFTLNGVKMFKGFELPNPMQSRAISSTHAQSVYYGVFLQHDDGVSLYCARHSTRMMSVGFYEYSLGGMSEYLGGLSMLTRRRIVGMRRLSFNVLERLPPRFSSALAAARECGLREPSQAPSLIRDLLASVPASL